MVLVSRFVVICSLAASCAAAAAPKRSKTTPAPVVTPAPSPVSAPAAKPDVQLPAGLSATEALAQLRALYHQALEYSAAVAYAKAVLARDDLSLEQRIEAYELQGMAKAIVEDPVDAEVPFRMLLRARPEYDMAPSTPPKILAVFRKVQSEERALAAQLREVERSRVVASLRISDGPPSTSVGGQPITFAYRVRDTAGVVETVRVQYRRAGQKAFSSLALERTADGEWRATIPGELTADEASYTLEYVTETADRQGPLLSVGTEASPRTIAVSPGQVPVKAFKPIPKAVFWTSAGVTAATGAAAGVMALMFQREQASFDSTIATGSAEGRALVAQIGRGETYAAVTNGLLIAAGVTLAVTLLFFPFTRFVDE